MKLDHECMRQVLFSIEEHFRPTDAWTTQRLHETEKLRNYTLDDVNYSIHQLRDAHLLWTNARPTTIGGQDYWTVRGLTPESHAFIEAIRKDTAWSAIKTKAAAFGLVTISALVNAAADKAADVINVVSP